MYKYFLPLIYILYNSINIKPFHGQSEALLDIYTHIYKQNLLQCALSNLDSLFIKSYL